MTDANKGVLLAVMFLVLVAWFAYLESSRPHDFGKHYRVCLNEDGSVKVEDRVLTEGELCQDYVIRKDGTVLE